ncbi:MAG: SPW repeat protein [Calditrichia bacterium]
MWARILNALIGVWLMASPAVLGFTGSTRINNLIIGPLAASMAIIAIWETTRGLRWVNVVFGGWMLLAPWILGYGDWIARGNSLLAGVLLIIFGLIKGEVSGNYGGGWSYLFRSGDERV